MSKRILPNLLMIIGIIVGLSFILYVPSIFKADLNKVLDFDVTSGYSLILLSVFTIALSIIVYFNHSGKTLPNDVYKK